MTGLFGSDCSPGCECDEIPFPGCDYFPDCFVITDFNTDDIDPTLATDGCHVELVDKPLWDGSSELVGSVPANCNWGVDLMSKSIATAADGHGIQGYTASIGIVSTVPPIAELGIGYSADPGCGTSEPTPNSMWIGEKSITDWDLTGVYTRIGGQSPTPATLTVAACPP